MKPLSTLLISSMITLTLSACSSDSSDKSVDTEDIKANHVSMAFAAYSDSLAAAESLQSAVTEFIDNPTENNLSTAKAAYKALRIPYQQSEIMRWDTAITLDFNLNIDGGPASVDEWEGQVNAWPLDENHIVDIIEGSDTIDRDLLLAQNGADDNEANVTTGIHAVEFMLWGADTNGVNAGSGERPATDFALSGSCADSYCQRRAEYLQAATDLLVDDLNTMAAEWSPTATNTQGTLAYNFLQSPLAIDYMLGAMRAMATDELASARMSSGLTLGDPEEEHDCFSDLSHLAIYHNFQGVRNVFFGQYNTVSGTSLASLVRYKDPTSYNRFVEALDSIELKMQYLLEIGERETNPIRFDQIIGQEASGNERQIAEAAVDELIALDSQFNSIKELLSLSEISTDGDSD